MSSRVTILSVLLPCVIVTEYQGQSDRTSLHKRNRAMKTPARYSNPLHSNHEGLNYNNFSAGSMSA